MVFDDFPTKNVAIRKCWFKNSGACAVFAVGTGSMDNLVIEENVVENFAESALRAFNCGYTRIVDNRCLGDNTNTSNVITAFGTGCLIVERNFISKNGSLGFGLAIANAGPGTSISYNQIFDSQADGFDFMAIDNDVVGPWQIIGNIVDSPNVAAVEVGIAVVAYAGRILSNGAVRDNIISKRWFMGITCASIASGAIVANVDVSDNTIADCNQVGGVNVAETAAIVCTASAGGGQVSRITATDNRIRTSDGKTKYIFSEVQNAGLVDGNLFLNNYAATAGSISTNKTGPNTTATNNIPW
jgi:hypothetical protein